MLNRYNAKPFGWFPKGSQKDTVDYMVLDEYSIEKGFPALSSFDHCGKLLYSSDLETKKLPTRITRFRDSVNPSN